MNFQVLRRIIIKTKGFINTCIEKITRIPIIFQDFQQFQDNSSVTLYTNYDSLWPNYPYRQKTDLANDNIQNRKISLIACVKNEANNINSWFESIFSQTIKPDEIIISEGGSSDDTLELLNYHRVNRSIPIHILSNSGGNIAQGRNLAIRHANNEIIAVTDFGCLPAIDWMEKITNPFFIDNEVVLSAGIYDPLYRKRLSPEWKKLWSWGNLSKISPQDYLPPGGSAAFRKDVWQKVGGYPEWLTQTGEDTLFDLELKKLGGKWAFVPEAINQWFAPEDFISYLRKLFNWAIGDGEMKINGRYYLKFIIRGFFSMVGLASITFAYFILSIYFPTHHSLLNIYYPSVLLIGLFLFYLWAKNKGLSFQSGFYKLFGSISQVIGYIKGSRRQAAIFSRRYHNTKGLIILLSGVPIDDTGGGARCTQITLELLKRNYIVLFLYRFPKNESKELNLIINHPNLVVKSIQEINYRQLLNYFLHLHPRNKLIAITEHPIRDFLPVIKYINRKGGKTIYDKIDQWESSLGGNWYTEKIEGQIIKQNQVLTATAPTLVNHLQINSGRKVHLLPNAVNSELFNPLKTYQIPDDLPEGDWKGIYIGALWGDWFDWKLLGKIADAYPTASFIIIGDYREKQKFFPPNIYFLGLKKQSFLPAYLKYSDVAMIPWKVSPITQATSPLKVYEYLAMECPVVAMNLKPLNGIPGVYRARDTDDFISSLDNVRKIKLDKKAISSFIAENSWNIRIQQLLDICH